jgi:UDP-N-acetylmuramoylalanine-D-glutamate ligase
MKILVTGSRNYTDRNKVFEVLSKLKPSFIIQGGATGADFLAKEFALVYKIDYDTVEAEWSIYGSSAGPRRNQEMLNKHPDIELVVAFPGNKGTADMVRRASKQNIKILHVE